MPTVPPDLEGAWRPTAYVMRDGTRHDADGVLMLSGGHWATLFFLVDRTCAPTRASGQGGTYRLDGDELTLIHRFHLSAGAAVAGSPAADADALRLSPDAHARVEHCRVERLGALGWQLWLPTGNCIRFEPASLAPIP